MSVWDFGSLEVEVGFGLGLRPQCSGSDGV